MYTCKCFCMYMPSSGVAGYGVWTFSSLLDNISCFFKWLKDRVLPSYTCWHLSFGGFIMMPQDGLRFHFPGNISEA